jgi:hypothetical protein
MVEELRHGADDEEPQLETRQVWHYIVTALTIRCQREGVTVQRQDLLLDQVSKATHQGRIGGTIHAELPRYGSEEPRIGVCAGERPSPFKLGSASWEILGAG